MEIERTCLSCRKKADKHKFCRFVRANDGEIRFDEKGDLPHRGAFVCSKKSCLIKAFSKKLLFKGERTIPVHQDLMLTTITNLVKKSALARLGLIKRLGKMEVGRDAVKRVILEDKVQAVIFAKDLSARSLDEFKRLSENFSSIAIVQCPLLMDQLGQCLGRKKTGVVALMESRITGELLSRMDKLPGTGKLAALTRCFFGFFLFFCSF